jgi:hypothetical protein
MSHLVRDPVTGRTRLVLDKPVLKPVLPKPCCVEKKAPAPASVPAR